MMKNQVLLLTICLLSVVGCSSEKAKIKKALKTTIPIEQVGEYKFKSYTITETLLKNNVEDSIASLNNRNMTKQMMIELQQQRRNGYIVSLEDCKRQKRNTLSWLRSSYDSIIRDWQRMIDETNQKIQQDSSVIIANNQKIAFFKDYLDKTKTPIVFYKVNHSYTLRGMIKNEDVMLDDNYKPVKYE